LETIFVISITIARKIFFIPLIINPSWKVSSNLGIKADEIRYLNLSLKKLQFLLLSICMSVCLSLCLFESFSLKKIGISIVVHLVRKCFIFSVCLSVCLFVFLSVCLLFYLSVFLSICRSARPFFYLSVSLSMCLYVFLSVYCLKYPILSYTFIFHFLIYFCLHEKWGQRFAK
jgi:hypothetical protein